MLQGREEKRPEASANRGRHRDIALVDQPREKTLNRVLRILGCVSESSDVRIQWIPVRAAKRLHCPKRLRFIVAAGGQDNAPMSRRKSLRFLMHLSFPQHALMRAFCPVSVSILASVSSTHAP